jgi:hypothetical protein
VVTSATQSFFASLGAEQLAMVAGSLVIMLNEHSHLCPDAACFR